MVTLEPVVARARQAGESIPGEARCSIPVALDCEESQSVIP